MRYAALILILLAGAANAGEKFKCQAGTPWISGYKIVLRATINDDKETGTIQVSGVLYQTTYSVEGINRRWDWDMQEDSSYDYAFVLKPGGTGFFFDFSSAEGGETNTSSQSFSCK